MPKAASVSVGSTYSTSNGECKVLRYEGAFKVKVKFQETGTIVWCRADHLRRGVVKDPLYPSVLGVGFLGIGEYSFKADYRAYKLWAAMLQRCYTKSGRHSSYAGCRVVKSWHNFQTFAAWCVAQPNWNMPDFHLDKDLRVLGNKKYGPKYCSFVPAKVNTLFQIDTKTTGIKRKSSGRFVAFCKSFLTGYVVIGNYGTEREARSAYLKYKKKMIKRVADHFKNVLHIQVYTNLISWRIAA